MSPLLCEEPMFKVNTNKQIIISKRLTGLPKRSHHIDRRRRKKDKTPSETKLRQEQSFCFCNGELRRKEEEEIE